MNAFIAETREKIQYGDESIMRKQLAAEIEMTMRMTQELEALDEFISAAKNGVEEQKTTSAHQYHSTSDEDDAELYS